MLLGILRNLLGQVWRGVSTFVGWVLELWGCGGCVGLGAAEFVTKRGYVIPCFFQTVMLVLEIDGYLRKQESAPGNF